MIDPLKASAVCHGCATPFCLPGGLFGRPTFGKHNYVEMLYWVRDILGKRAHNVHRIHGRHGAKAAAHFPVSGRVNNLGCTSCTGSITCVN